MRLSELPTPEQKLRELNLAKQREVEAEIQKKLTKAAPAESVVQGWIDEAKGMEPKISH